MNYKKIGEFILNERKAKNLTQTKLAEKIFVSEKTVSKWENGKGVPDTNTLPLLCEIFDVSINELLNGERISKESYTTKAEEKILDLQREKEMAHKRLLFMEIIVAFLAMTILLSASCIVYFINMPTWLRILILAVAFTITILSMIYALKIEQVAGYYLCEHCNHKHIPSYSQVFLAMHLNRTRYMKCPQCKKRSWQRKVLK